MTKLAIQIDMVKIAQLIMHAKISAKMPGIRLMKVLLQVGGEFVKHGGKLDKRVKECRNKRILPGMSANSDRTFVIFF